ncbi:phosphoadenosine phosphosulfate reductase family protein [Ahrensia sp. R2A130]|uniref:phosphoadenosine phosphosulfate reductase family protein n=1 Tax=Ahrensia sp. R2A130 TaxID=744979 RepID=UPI0001E0BC6D|nr:phosphoadenosine phosphosulfate reductase family protein [Ahrensia sp. R2A130]EFL89439.1 phosphoadenosine phosphosulfate reductase [Ahrensia sp. R2A130]
MTQMKSPNQPREIHVLGLSGGRDSASLAVWMRQNRPEIDIKYFFTDTGKELKEVYDYLGELEGFIGKPIERLNADRDFDFWLKQYGHFLPSPRTRWCTRKLKIEPFEHWLKPELEAGTIVHSYVAIRADEPDRSGMIATHPNMKVHFPLREAGLDKAAVIELLDSSGLGLPAYYRWRSRSGCTFCFYQQKIEWVRLMREHPDAFEEAKSYEKSALEHGSPFTWTQKESLDELARPERVAQIEKDYDLRVARRKAKQLANPLRARLSEIDIDEVYGVPEAASGCLTCHK